MRKIAYTGKWARKQEEDSRRNVVARKEDRVGRGVTGGTVQDDRKTDKGEVDLRR